MNKKFSLLTFDFSDFLQKRADLLLGLVLMGILGLMLLPLPVFLMDLAIALNFAFSFVLLATALYISAPTQIASFPTLLLLTTLFRLGISIATTRMILLEADAGEMIQAFGALVVGGSLAVGLVIFLLLTIIQLIVVSKGAERVAEVAARFTLDSIPGRQMSIDADLRAGLISAIEARRLREGLERETHLLGSLDGAMKFVKGDAIASIVIALVNFIGGIAVGMLVSKMPFGEALQVYSLLTIGDGLVSQIPSLIICATAAIIMTRVSGSQRKQHLGGDMFDQIVANPKAILMAAGGCVIVGMIPGFPHWQFLLAALALLLLGLARMRQAQLIANSQRAPMPSMARDGASYLPLFLDDVEQGTSAPLRLRVSQTAFDVINPVALDQELAAMRAQLMQQAGLPFPGLSLQIDPALPRDSYVLDIDDVPAANGNLFAAMVMVLGPAEAVLELVRSARSPAHPGWGDEQCAMAARWVPAEFAAELAERGYTALPPDGAICAHLLKLLTTQGHQLFGIQEARHLLDTLDILFPEIVSELQRQTSAAQLTPVLRQLLQEGVSIRNLRGIVEAVIQLPSADRTVAQMVASARIRLARTVLQPQLNEQGCLPSVILDGAWETVLGDSLRTNAHGEPELVLHLRDMEHFQHQLAQQLGRHPGHVPVLTTAQLRGHVWQQLTAIGLPRTVVALEECHAAGVRPDLLDTIRYEENGDD